MPEMGKLTPMNCRVVALVLRMELWETEVENFIPMRASLDHGTMEEDINPNIAELEISKPIRSVIKNILDDPIPAAVKSHVLEPLLPGKPTFSTAPHTQRARVRPSQQKDRRARLQRNLMSHW